jgi:hypothetical protein
VGQIRLGMVIVMWGAAVFIPFTATIADFVARFEGRNGPLTRTMTMAGYANAMLTFYPPLWWIATTWRVDERSADTTRMLNDIAWLQFIGGLSLIMPMFVVLAVVAFNDKSESPISTVVRLPEHHDVHAVPARSAAVLLQDRALRLERRPRILGAADRLRQLVHRHLRADAPRAGGRCAPPRRKSTSARRVTSTAHPMAR